MERFDAWKKLSFSKKALVVGGLVATLGGLGFSHHEANEYLTSITCQEYGALRDYPRELQEGYLKQDQPNPWYGPRADIWEWGIGLQADRLKDCN